VYNNDTLENWIPLGETHRIAVRRQETEAVNPIAEYYENVGCWTVTQARNLNPINLNIDDNVRETIDRVYEETEAQRHADLQNELIHELEKIHGLIVIPVSLRGYSQGEWMDVLLFTKPESGLYESGRHGLDLIRDDLEAWFRGDVYILSVEEMVVYTAPNGKTITRWETVEDVDPVWDNYFSNRPAVEDLLDRLSINPIEYGADRHVMELMN
jgi:hypothetical protein